MFSVFFYLSPPNHAHHKRKLDFGHARKKRHMFDKTTNRENHANGCEWIRRIFLFSFIKAGQWSTFQIIRVYKIKWKTFFLRKNKVCNKILNLIYVIFEKCPHASKCVSNQTEKIFNLFFGYRVLKSHYLILQLLSSPFVIN